MTSIRRATNDAATHRHRRPSRSTAWSVSWRAALAAAMMLPVSAALWYVLQIEAVGEVLPTQPPLERAVPSEPQLPARSNWPIATSPAPVGATTTFEPPGVPVGRPPSVSTTAPHALQSYWPAPTPSELPVPSERGSSPAWQEPAPSWPGFPWHN